MLLLGRRRTMRDPPPPLSSSIVFWGSHAHGRRWAFVLPTCKIFYLSGRERKNSKDEASRAQRVDIQARAVLHAVAERVPYAPEPVRLQAQSRSCSLSPRLLVGTCHDCTLRLQVSGIELLARFRLRRTCMRAPVVLLNPKEPRFNADACEHHCVARSCSTSAAACRQLQIAGRMANESGPLGHRCSTRSSGSTPKFSSAL